MVAYKCGHNLAWGRVVWMSTWVWVCGCGYVGVGCVYVYVCVRHLRHASVSKLPNVVVFDMPRSLVLLHTGVDLSSILFAPPNSAGAEASLTASVSTFPPRILFHPACACGEGALFNRLAMHIHETSTLFIRFARDVH